MNGKGKFVVGLTGGIGSGKSLAAKTFLALGIQVIDADDLSRAVVQPGQRALSEIAGHFGKEILLEDGSLDRAALRTMVFSNPAHKSWLENLLHPLIAELLQNRLKDAVSDYVVLESPLLLETDQHKLVDRILVVDVSEEIQLARATERDGSDTSIIEAIIASQMERSERSRRAHDVVLNEGSPEQLKERILSLHSLYMQMATQQ